MLLRVYLPKSGGLRSVQLGGAAGVPAGRWIPGHVSASTPWGLDSLPS